MDHIDELLTPWCSQFHTWSLFSTYFTPLCNDICNAIMCVSIQHLIAHCRQAWHIHTKSRTFTVNQAMCQHRILVYWNLASRHLFLSSLYTTENVEISSIWRVANNNKINRPFVLRSFITPFTFVTLWRVDCNAIAHCLWIGGTDTPHSRCFVIQLL